MMIRKICGICLPVVVAAFLFTGCGQLGNHLLRAVSSLYRIMKAWDRKARNRKMLAGNIRAA